MITIHDISSDTCTDESVFLMHESARVLQISPKNITKLEIAKKSLDARKKPAIKFIYSVNVSLSIDEKSVLKKAKCKKAEITKEYVYSIPKIELNGKSRPVIVGFGPAGMFAGLVLAKAGCKPIILERGDDVDTRRKKAEHFFKTGQLDTESNVQFGEGGAGTFSDGKLNTGIKDYRIKWILEQFVKAGADKSILYDSKPHVGTDVLVYVVKSIRKRIIELGGEVHFMSKVSGLSISDNSLNGVILSNGNTVPCSHCIFAIGHSARDTVEMMYKNNISMEAKPFSMGVRIEHKQKDINISQYGKNDALLPSADYKLVCHLKDRTVYTFCMCPGGYVVAASSENAGVVTNGMSNFARDNENANSALLVTLNPSDFPEKDALSGMRWQRKIENDAFIAGGSNYYAPAQLVGDFLSNKSSTAPGEIIPTYRPGVVWCNLDDVLPDIITKALKEALAILERKISGFSKYDAVLTAPETRSSSPVRIIRNDLGQSSVKGLYPVGEGAGYAGGIISAAVDGIKTAEIIIKNLMQ